MQIDNSRFRSIQIELQSLYKFIQIQPNRVRLAKLDTAQPGWNFNQEAILTKPEQISDAGSSALIRARCHSPEFSLGLMLGRITDKFWVLGGRFSAMSAAISRSQTETSVSWVECPGILERCSAQSTQWRCLNNILVGLAQESEVLGGYAQRGMLAVEIERLCGSACPGPIASNRHSKTSSAHLGQTFMSL